ncbi:MULTISPECIES: radical SAM protein [unclassified Bradyrhizobium]|uniref:radical SAM protein n=1 Tax=unclassified Bradyrhizobium TaxID=2631580 RepID=UPI002916CE37|nr:MULTISPECIES: radical SAM protein [unclassified Bradyrhizobium]
MKNEASRYNIAHVNEWNFLLHWSAMLAVFQARKAKADQLLRAIPPITVEVDPVDHCNHQCPWCFTLAHRATDRLSEATVNKVIKELGQMGAKSVHFAGGGEPTLFRRFAARRGSKDPSPDKSVQTLLDAVKSAGLVAGLITNGSTLRILDPEFLTSRLAWIRVSIDAGTEARYQAKHRPKGHTLKDVHLGIADVIGKRAAGIYPTIGASFIFEQNTSEMKDEILKFVSDLAALGADFVQIKPENNNRGADADRFLASFRTEIASKLKGGVTLAIMNAPHRHSAHAGYCWYSHFGPVVGATGDVFACCYTYGMPEFRYGNLDEYGNSFQNLWGSAERLNLSSTIDPKGCHTCRHRSFNELGDRLYLLGEGAWHSVTQLLDLIDRGAEVDPQHLPENLRWMDAGFAQYRRLRSIGHNDLLQYPVYRPTEFIGG